MVVLTFHVVMREQELRLDGERDLLGGRVGAGPEQHALGPAHAALHVERHVALRRRVVRAHQLERLPRGAKR